MNKKLILLVALYLLLPALGIFSCRKTGSRGLSPSKYKIMGMNGAIFCANYYDSEYPSLTNIVNDTVAYNQFAIRLNMTSTEYDYASVREIPVELIPSAYADIVVPILTTSETIDSIEIYCNTDFSPTKIQGDDLSDLFDVVAYNKYNNGSTKMDLRQYVSTKPFTATELVLLLKSPPATAQKNIFTVKYYQDGIDHDYFEYTCPSVVVKP